VVFEDKFVCNATDNCVVPHKTNRCIHFSQIDTKFTGVRAAFIAEKTKQIVIDTIVKIVGKKIVNAAEIRCYIKTRCQLGVSDMESFEEFCDV
jgi:hypothetical protein